MVAFDSLIKKGTREGQKRMRIMTMRANQGRAWCCLPSPSFRGAVFSLCCLASSTFWVVLPFTSPFARCCPSPPRGGADEQTATCLFSTDEQAAAAFSVKCGRDPRGAFCGLRTPILICESQKRKNIFAARAWRGGTRERERHRSKATGAVRELNSAKMRWRSTNVQSCCPC